MVVQVRVHYSPCRCFPGLCCRGVVYSYSPDVTDAVDAWRYAEEQRVWPSNEGTEIVWCRDETVEPVVKASLKLIAVEVSEYG